MSLDAIARQDQKMRMSSRSHIARSLTPPLVWNYAKKNLPFLVRGLGGHFTHIRFEGDFPDFPTAKAQSKGYDDQRILEKTRGALLKVKNGQNRWEQDAMVSDSDELPWSLLAALLRIAAQNKARSLRVLDFGGSLGSLYFWTRPYLRPALDALHWHIVEQPAHVAVGRADFQSEELHFHETIEAAVAEARPDVLILSGVIHFLPDPEAFLAKLLNLRLPYFILDRTPLWNERRHRLTIQHVPAEIYEASYPAWFLDEQRILSLIAQTYDVMAKIPSPEIWEIDTHAVQSVQWQFQLRTPS